MTDPANITPAEVPSAAACAEAAAWIARLHGEGRTAKIEAGFKRWLASSPEHRAAFELANEIWAGTEHLPKTRVPAFVRWPKAGFVLTLPRAFAAAALIAIVAIGGGLIFRDSALTTHIGEQRNLTLEDGTRLSLNTSSRVHVRYDHTARRVVLDEGEAYFEVAKHADWPFIVIAGGRQVVARGTVFLVRRDRDNLTVTLVEGKVTVAPVGESVTSLANHSSGVSATAESGTAMQSRPRSRADFTLSPGQRLTILGHNEPRIDKPSLERVTAWQRGQVILDHTPLGEAAAEMNRYSDVELTIAEPEARRAEVTGIFRLGDSEAFAKAVAETYHLQVVDRAGGILLSGRPPSTNTATNE